MTWGLVVLALIGTLFAAEHLNRGIGPRADSRSRFAVRIGSRDVPRLTRSSAFVWTAWICRRLLPFVGAATAVEAIAWLSGEEGNLPFSAIDWMTACGIVVGVYLAGLPHGRLRTSPLTNWATMLLGLFGVLIAAGLLTQQYVVRSFPSLFDSALWARMHDWALAHPAAEVNGWAIAAFGLGLSLISLAETTRRWKTSDLPRPDSPVQTQKVESGGFDPDTPAATQGAGPRRARDAKKRKRKKRRR